MQADRKAGRGDDAEAAPLHEDVQGLQGGGEAVGSGAEGASRADAGGHVVVENWPFGCVDELEENGEPGGSVVCRGPVSEDRLAVAFEDPSQGLSGKRPVGDGAASVRVVGQFPGFADRLAFRERLAEQVGQTVSAPDDLLQDRLHLQWLHDVLPTGPQYPGASGTVYQIHARAETVFGGAVPRGVATISGMGRFPAAWP